VRLWGLDRTDLLPSARGLATSAISEVAPLVCWSVSPLSNSARRADRLSEAWLRLRCTAVLRDVERPRDGGGGGLDLFLLVEGVRAGFEFLPRPR
jgi:hypothetical protein